MLCWVWFVIVWSLSSSSSSPFSHRNGGSWHIMIGIVIVAEVAAAACQTMNSPSYLLGVVPTTTNAHNLCGFQTLSFLPRRQTTTTKTQQQRRSCCHNLHPCRRPGFITLTTWRQQGQQGQEQVGLSSRSGRILSLSLMNPSWERISDIKRRRLLLLHRMMMMKEQEKQEDNDNDHDDSSTSEWNDNDDETKMEFAIQEQQERSLLLWSQKQETIAMEFQPLLSVQEIQKRLLQKGFAHQQQEQQQEQYKQQQKEETIQQQSAMLLAQSQPTQVTGCTAHVVIQVSLWQLLTEDDEEETEHKEHKEGDMKYRYERRQQGQQRPGRLFTTVSGTCDALVSRGLVALWSTMCYKQCPNVILQQEAYSLADQWGLRHALSPGRNDGLASLVRTTQQLLSPLLLHLQTTTQEQQQQQQHKNTNCTMTVQDHVNDGKRDTFPTQPTTTPLHFVSTVPDNHNNKMNGVTPTYANPKQLLLQPSSSSSSSSSSFNGHHHDPPRVALLLSGGVDSSVALHLLLRQGYNVTAFYLKIWLQDEVAHLGTCPWEDDVQMCRQVCQHASDVMTSNNNNNHHNNTTTTTKVIVPLQILSLQREYQEQVIAHTIQEASAGRTPNPDILCNSRIKFGCFYTALEQMCHNNNNNKDNDIDNNKNNNNYNRPTFDYIATGHYAQLQRNDENGLVRLLRAPDPVKDQSYFLCALTQGQLSKVLFPIGHLEKQQVRQLAEQWQLPNRQRPDSQGLCFLGKVKFNDFVQSYLGEQHGPILDAITGQWLGEHRGVWFHTVGQRKGIGPYLHPQATAMGPWYVVAKDPSRHVVYCSNQYHGSDQFEVPRSEFNVQNLTWITGRAPSSSLSSSSRTVMDATIMRTNSPADEANTTTTATAHTRNSNDGDHHHHCTLSLDEKNNSLLMAETPWPKLMLRLDMKIRHGPNIVQGWLVIDDTTTNNNNNTNNNNMDSDCGRVRLDSKDGGLAPGQYVVFYDPETTECLGGGVIGEDHWTQFVSSVTPQRTTKEQQQQQDEFDLQKFHQASLQSPAPGQ